MTSGQHRLKADLGATPTTVSGVSCFPWLTADMCPRRESADFGGGCGRPCRTRTHAGHGHGVGLMSAESTFSSRDFSFLEAARHYRLPVLVRFPCRYQRSAVRSVSQGVGVAEIAIAASTGPLTQWPQAGRGNDCTTKRPCAGLAGTMNDHLDLHPSASHAAVARRAPGGPLKAEPGADAGPAAPQRRRLDLIRLNSATQRGQRGNAVSQPSSSVPSCWRMAGVAPSRRASRRRTA